LQALQERVTPTPSTTRRSTTMLSRTIQHALVVLVAASALAASPAFSEPAAHT
jgi:hypothetical protein